jgi:uncharacterized membrane protein YdjX (TVP38/TMEM64 family)
LGSKKLFKFGLALVALTSIVLFFSLGLDQYFHLEYLKTRRSELTNFYQLHRSLTLAIYFGAYVLITALSLPGATVMTLAAGAFFGLLTGTILASFASTIGATLAFLASRFLFRDWVQDRFKTKLKIVNQGIEKDGNFYLLTLRLVPLFPFFLVNLVLGVTPIKTGQFFLISQVGMLAGTIVFVYAGTQLAQLESLKDILSPNLILALTLIGLLPLLTKQIVNFFSTDRYRRKP